MTSLSISLHPLLQYSHQDVIGTLCSHILWDLREPPSTCVRHVSKPTKRMPMSDLSQYATSPPVASLHIICDLFPFPWRIEARNYRGVTILDVLETIYYTLCVRIRPIEWERMSEKHKERVGLVFHQRWTSSPDPPPVRSNGVIRADCLLQSTCFAGLSASLEKRSVFILSLARNSRLR